MTKSSASLGGAIPNAAWVPTMEESMIRGSSTHISVVRTKRWTDVQAVAFLVRYPVLVNADELLHQFNDGISIE